MADRRLQVFHAVATQGSFTKAAEMLFMAQPTVTFQIKQLEMLYQTRLFDRQHGRIALTSSGELVLAYAEKILALSDELETRLQDLTQEIRGDLRLGASTTFAQGTLTPLLLEFNALYPQVKICLHVGSSLAIAEAVEAQGLDLALVDHVALPVLQATACGDDELVMVCAQDHPLAKLRHATPAQLADYEYLARDAKSGSRADTDAYFQQAGVDPATLKVQMELGSPDALRQMAEGGLGFVILSRTVLDAMSGLKRLKAIPFKPALKRSLHLIHPRERFMTRLVTTFIEFALRYQREHAS